MLTLLSLLVPLAAGEAEPACLVQKPKAPTQLSLLTYGKMIAVVGWDYMGLDFASGNTQRGDCEAVLGTFSEPNPTSCASQCDSLSPQPLAFSFDESTLTCHCCDGLVLTSYEIPAIAAIAFARAVPSWHCVAVGKTCVDEVVPFQASTLNDCGVICGSQITEGWFIYKEIGQTCECCSGLDVDLRLVEEPGPEAAKTWVYRKEDVPGWDYLGLGICITSISTHQSIPSLQECSEVCASDSNIQQPNGFVYGRGLSSQICECCFGLLVSDTSLPMKAKIHITFGFTYAKADPFWKVLADFQKCVTPVATSFPNTLADCAKSCEPPATGKWLVYGPDNQCNCCGDDGLAVETPGAGPGGLGYHLAPLSFPEVPGWKFQGRRLDCDGPPVAEFSLAASPPSACGEFCALQRFPGFPVGGMVIDQNFPAIADATCKCCGSLSPEAGKLVKLVKLIPQVRPSP